MPIEVYQRDGENLPFEDDSFDSGVSFEVLEHTPDPGRLLCELARVVKPGGPVVVTTPNTLWEPVHWLAAVTGLHHGEGPHRNISRKSILAALTTAGLRVVAERTTVLVPAGPDLLVHWGRTLEGWLPHSILRVVGLRRIFLCISCQSSPKRAKPTG